MSEIDLSKVFPGWNTEGILGAGDFGTVYLIRNAESGAFSAMRLIKMPPSTDAIDNAVKLGISRDLLTTYFTKFKNDLSWEPPGLASTSPPPWTPWPSTALSTGRSPPPT